MFQGTTLATQLLEAAHAGSELSTSIYTSATARAQRDKNFMNLAGDVALIANALVDLAPFFERGGSGFVATQYAIEDARTVLSRVWEAFHALLEIIRADDGQQPWEYVLLKVYGSAREAKVDAQRKRLESLKSSLTLLLSVFNIKGRDSQNVRIEQNVQQQRQAVHYLYEQHVEAIQDMPPSGHDLGQPTIKNHTSRSIVMTSPTNGSAYEVHSVPESSEGEEGGSKPLDHSEQDTRCDLMVLMASTKQYLESIEMTAHTFDNCRPRITADLNLVRRECQVLLCELQSRMSTWPLASKVPAPTASSTGLAHRREKIDDSGAFDLEFTADGPDVTECFDFDSFQHNAEDEIRIDYDFISFGDSEAVNSEQPEARDSQVNSVSNGVVGGDAENAIAEDRATMAQRTVLLAQSSQNSLVPKHGPTSGNHALEAYQNQLMELEALNKKRVLMSRLKKAGLHQALSRPMQLGDDGAETTAHSTISMLGSAKSEEYDDWLFGTLPDLNDAETVVQILLARWTEPEDLFNWACQG